MNSSTMMYVYFICVFLDGMHRGLMTPLSALYQSISSLSICWIASVICSESCFHLAEKCSAIVNILHSFQLGVPEDVSVRKRDCAVIACRYSFEIVRRLPELKALGFPLLLGPSRKSFLARVSPGRNLSTEERLIPGVALSTIAAWLGVDILRTHDVHAGQLLLDTVQALRSAS